MIADLEIRGYTTKSGKGQAILRYRARQGTLERLLGKNQMKRKASIPHEAAIIRDLRKSPKFAAEYLRAALEEEDEPRVLLIALRRVAQARGGLAKIAKAAGIERESL